MIFSFAIAFTITASVSYSENAVTLSQIQGLDPARGLMIDVPIRYFMQFEVGGTPIIASMNRFKIYSPDGATWQAVTGHEALPLDNVYDGFHGFSFDQFVSDGLGLDTLSFGGFSIFAPGFASGFSGEVFYFETSLTEEDLGKSLCLDSLNIEPSDTWVWQFPNLDTLQPAWSGQVCYEIVACCVGNRGDVNGDGVGPNILDLNSLVNYVFRGEATPICKNESDVNADGMNHNMLDLNFVVNRIFRGGPAPGPCPVD